MLNYSVLIPPAVSSRAQAFTSKVHIVLFSDFTFVIDIIRTHTYEMNKVTSYIWVDCIISKNLAKTESNSVFKTTGYSLVILHQSVNKLFNLIPLYCTVKIKMYFMCS